MSEDRSSAILLGVQIQGSRSCCPQLASRGQDITHTHSLLIQKLGKAL